jgi:hypothetical protein
MKVAGLAVCAAAARRHKLTDEQVPLSLSTFASALPLEQGTIGPDRPSAQNRIPPVPFRSGTDGTSGTICIFLI